MFGYRGYYEPEPWSWGGGGAVGGPRRHSSRRRQQPFPVYGRHYGHAPWLPPGHLALYGPGHYGPAHHYYDPEFRSNSANLPLPPSVEYVWSSGRPPRRTKSSAHPRAAARYPAPPRHPPSPQFYSPPPEPPPLVHHSSFARRFFNDREHKTEAGRARHQHRVLIEPDVHEAGPGQGSLHSGSLQLSRPGSRSQSSHSQATSRAPSRGSSGHQHRVISDLLPPMTAAIHGAVLGSSAAQPHHPSCTCYQCSSPGSQRSPLHQASLDTRTKAPIANLVEDINSNLVSAGSASPVSAHSSLALALARTSSVTPKSTAAARRHLKRAATQGRLLGQAELLKLGQFRRFLHSSGLSQLDFLYRVEQVRKQRQDEASAEVDEDGNPAHSAGSWREESDQEFVALCALLLCGDLSLKQDTFQAITNKQEIRERLYGLVSPATDGIVTADQVIETIASTKCVRERNELAGENLRWLEKVFQRTVGDHGEITLNDFKTIVQSKNPFFVERVFQIFDKDDSGSISFQEFIDAIHQFAGQTPEDKIKFLFKVYDIDGDGLIQEAELQHVMRACMDENGMSFDEESVEELTRALYQDAASSLQPGITYASLKSQISKHDGLLENLTISIDRWLVPPKPKRIIQAVNDAFRVSIPREVSFTYIRNNAQFILFHILFFVTNLGLFVSRLAEYRDAVNIDGSRAWALMVARAAGQCLNFTCMFILLPMLRLSMTKLRQKGFNYLLPLDKHTWFHRLTGHLIVFYTILHTLAHVANLVINILVDPVAFLINNGIPPPEHWGVNITDVSPLSPLGVAAPAPAYTVTHVSPAPATWTASTWLLTSAPGMFGLVPGLANPTGLVLLIVLAVMVVCSMKWVRKSGNFEVFYWTHFLYLVFWLLLVLHSPNFWKWFIAPACIFACEKLVSFCKSRTEKGKSYVVTGVVLPSKVVNLVIKRPPHFTFKPGDYVYVNIPSIANFEWHPFTISSAPEQTDTLSLHIRAVGQWTNSLYEYFEREQARLDGALSYSELSARKQDVLRKTYAEARDRARKLSASVGGAAGVSSSYNLWGQAGHLATGPDRHMRQLRRLDAGMIMNPGPGSGGDSVGVQIGRDEDSAAQLPANAKLVARNFRYMRRKPTIMAYKPPKDAIAEEEEDETPDLCSSNHFILDRIAEKDSTDNLFRAGSETRTESEGGHGAAAGADIRQVNNSLQVFIDGPFGAPTNLIFHAQHAVLIGTGIGVTPFASILQSIMHRYWAARNTCPKCAYRWTNDLKSQVMNLRKVDFFWINREQRSFEWFISLLSQLEIEQAEQGGAMERFLDMHMYITSALQKTDMKAVGLQLALELLHEKSKRDLITGLKTRTVAGRPNWDRVFKKLHEKRKGRVTVFFCGPPQLGKILKQKCTQFGFEYRKETF